MRNIPFSFISEETIDEINRVYDLRQASREAAGHHASPSLLGRLLAALDRMTEMSGPNSIANLERTFRPTERKRTDLR